MLPCALLLLEFLSPFASEMNLNCGWGRYKATLGDWSVSLVAVAAVTAILSSLITCMDGFARQYEAAARLLFPNWTEARYLPLIPRST